MYNRIYWLKSVVCVHFIFQGSSILFWKIVEDKRDFSWNQANVATSTWKNSGDSCQPGTMKPLQKEGIVAIVEGSNIGKFASIDC